MELILINSSKLKIMLTGDEMKKYDLDTDRIDYDTTATRKAFWSILDDAKSETGFDAASDKVFIQLYPSKKGGCEMYVTKLGDTSPSPRTGKSSRGAAKEKLQIISPSLRTGGKARMGAFAFDSLSALLSVCHRLKGMNWQGESHAYRDGDGACFLFLSDPDHGPYAAFDDLSFISEYGTRENADRLRLYISEHATCIREHDAVNVLGNL